MVAEPVEATCSLRQAQGVPSTGSGSAFDRLRERLRQAQGAPSTGSGSAFDRLRERLLLLYENSSLINCSTSKILIIKNFS